MTIFAIEDFFKKIQEKEDQLELARAEIRGLREALEFYADIDLWENTTTESTYDGVGCSDFNAFKSFSRGMYQVGGKRAREALARKDWTK